MNALIALLILMIVVLLWHAAASAREQVILACRKVCRELGLQFLDETVVLRSMRPRRGPSGRLTFERRYEFEFSASGQERCNGWAMALGESVERISLEHPDGQLIVSGKAAVSYSLLQRQDGGSDTPDERERAG